MHAPRCFKHPHPIYCKRIGYSWINGRRFSRYICPRCMSIHFLPL